MEEVPLQPHGRLKTLSAAVMLTKVNWGIGMIAMPFYLHSAGLGGGLSFFVLSMILAADAAVLTHRLRQVWGESTYVALMREAVGPKGQLVAVACVLVAGWGSAVAWTKFIGDNLARFLPFHLPSQGYIALVSLPLLCCAWVDEIRILERFSYVGLIAGQLFVILLLILVAPHWADWPAYVSSQPFIRWESFPVAMGLAVFCNEGLVVMSPEVSANMSHPEHFGISVVVAVIYFSLNYLLMSLCGDFLYSFLAHDEVAQEVTLSKAFYVTPAHQAMVLCYVLQLLLTFPSSLFVMFRNAEQLSCPAALRPLRLNRRAWRLALILSFAGVAMVLPRFGDFLAVFGAVGNSLCIYILPHWAFVKDGGWRSWSSLLVMLVFGLCCGGLAAVVSLQELL